MYGILEANRPRAVVSRATPAWHTAPELPPRRMQARSFAEASCVPRWNDPARIRNDPASTELQVLQALPHFPRLTPQGLSTPRPGALHPL